MLQRGAELAVPPAGKGHDQMIPQDVTLTKEVANVRIHVERSLQRVKLFRFLDNKINVSHFPVVDDIILVCCCLANIDPPLVRH